MELSGILKKVNEAVTNGNFTSRKIWITTDADSQYPQTIEVEVSQAKLGLFDNIAIGSKVTCSINLRGREWTNPQGVVKVFNTMSVWRVEVTGYVGQQTYAQQVGNPQPAANNYAQTVQNYQQPVQQAPANSGSMFDDSLPF